VMFGLIVWIRQFILSLFGIVHPSKSKNLRFRVVVVYSPLLWFIIRCSIWPARNLILN
jgi:hypothetical protein